MKARAERTADTGRHSAEKIKKAAGTEKARRAARGILVFSGLVAMTVLLGYLDHITGEKISLYILYIIPVFLASWYAGAWQGILISVLSGLTWYFVDTWTGTGKGGGFFEVWDLFVRIIFFSVMSFFISRLKREFDHQKKVAEEDYLTGLLNRRGFFRKVMRIKHEESDEPGMLTIMYIDLDNFKAINDTRGHEEGDRLLQSVAAVIKSNIRAHDAAGRLGGDEFAVLFNRLNRRVIKMKTDILRGLLGKEMKKHNWPVTFSIGAVSFANNPFSAEQMLKKADTLMYDVKKTGKGSVKYSVEQ